MTDPSRLDKEYLNLDTTFDVSNYVVHSTWCEISVIQDMVCSFPNLKVVDLTEIKRLPNDIKFFLRVLEYAARLGYLKHIKLNSCCRPLCS